MRMHSLKKCFQVRGPDQVCLRISLDLALDGQLRVIASRAGLEKVKRILLCPFRFARASQR